MKELGIDDIREELKHIPLPLKVASPCLDSDHEMHDGDDQEDEESEVDETGAPDISPDHAVSPAVVTSGATSFKTELVDKRSSDTFPRLRSNQVDEKGKDSVPYDRTADIAPGAESSSDTRKHCSSGSSRTQIANNSRALTIVDESFDSRSLQNASNQEHGKDSTRKSCADVHLGSSSSNQQSISFNDGCNDAFGYTVVPASSSQYPPVDIYTDYNDSFLLFEDITEQDLQNFSYSDCAAAAAAGVAETFHDSDEEEESTFTDQSELGSLRPSEWETLVSHSAPKVETDKHPRRIGRAGRSGPISADGAQDSLNTPFVIDDRLLDEFIVDWNSLPAPQGMVPSKPKKRSPELRCTEMEQQSPNRRRR